MSAGPSPLDPVSTPVKAAIVYNPAAGRRRGEPTARAVRKDLRARGLAAELHPTHGPRHAIDLARALAAQNDIIVAVGGDGTINEVVNGIAQATEKSTTSDNAGHRCRLGIVPAGTVNVLALELKIPRDVHRACAVIAADKSLLFDLGRIGEHRFALMAGAGIDALTIRNLDPRAKRLVKSLAFAVTGLKQALAQRPTEFLAQIDGVDHQVTFFVAGNCHYFAAHIAMTPGADPSDGLLDVMLFRGTTRRSVLGFWGALLFHRHVRRRDVDYLRATTIRLSPLSNETPVWSQTDGEITGELPAVVEIDPHAIEVLVP